MSLAALGLVAIAAVMHVTWNAMAKRSADQFVFVWAAVGLSALALSPAAIVVVAVGGLAVDHLWPVAASSAIHAVYFYSLGRAYSLGDLSAVYPIARGLSVALVAIGGWLVLAEELSPPGIAGLALVVTGVLGVGLGGRAAPAAVMWALLTAVLVASYSLVDKTGVTRLHPVFYVTAIGLGAAGLLAPAMIGRRAAVSRLWREGRRDLLISAALSLTAYLLVLFAFSLSKAAYVVASRELSIVASVIIGRAVLAERRSLRRLVAAAIIVAGVSLLATA